VATKMIPASELREGYSLVLPDGSSQVIVGITAENVGDNINPIVRMWVDVGTDKLLLFSFDEPVAVVAENDEF
jgi:hypothetical protein